MPTQYYHSSRTTSKCTSISHNIYMSTILKKKLTSAPITSIKCHTNSITWEANKQKTMKTKPAL